jgi:hypothetical protein
VGGREGGRDRESARASDVNGRQNKRVKLVADNTCEQNNQIIVQVTKVKLHLQLCARDDSLLHSLDSLLDDSLLNSL